MRIFVSFREGTVVTSPEVPGVFVVSVVMGEGEADGVVVATEVEEVPGTVVGMVVGTVVVVFVGEAVVVV
ncbi:MAG TPA: hypothetical protein PLU94_06670 [Methanoregulaceae archaeon]|nr:hypothetical protein [Methanoregulaceae archaeon]